jgi:serine/threonine-protein kinase
MGNKQNQIGHYKIIETLASGGMGEVFLAKDLTCGRTVALKQIRKDLASNSIIKERFLREAKLTAQLSHPSIIPIYSIHSEEERQYYTMPYVEGETLREIIKQTRKQEVAGEKLHLIGRSIPTLIRIFMHVCEAIAFAHSKGILHRDIKPENIIVGKYGEVLILDWGIASSIDSPDLEADVQMATSSKLTRPGKLAGTLAYMAPERALNKESSPLTDVYALGVILYQLLTLRLPFYRTTPAKFRKTHQHERLIDPQEMAPYRDIPKHLAHITMRSLAPNKENRYQSVESLIHDLKHYTDGRFEWIETAQLNIETKNAWEFQENILLAKHSAISQKIDLMEWVYLMVSKDSFSGNTKISTTVRLEKEGTGIGFLLCIPEAKQRKSLEEGYCLWIGSKTKKSSKLFRNNIEVINLSAVGLTANQSHLIEIEKIENSLSFYLDKKMVCRYPSHLPLTGTHVGILLRDTHIQMAPLTLSTASHNALVNCLAVPDSFLAANYYKEALLHYRRIGVSFSGQLEGRQALFRAALTLLEKGKRAYKKQEKQSLFTQALSEFDTLHDTPAAPLEYLGKSLIYKETKELEEEVKCLELCLRKYPKHPLLPPIAEQITFRLHETSSSNRLGAYHFALLALRFLPHLFDSPDHQQLLDSLLTQCSPLPFLENSPQKTTISLAFWLAKPLTLLDLAQNLSDPTDQTNAYYAYVSLGGSPQSLPNLAPPTLTLRDLLIEFRQALDNGKAKNLLSQFADLKERSLDIEQLHLETLIDQHQIQEAFKILESHTIFPHTKANTNFAVLYGCCLAYLKGEKVALTYLEESKALLEEPSFNFFYQALTQTSLPNSLIPYEKIELLRRLALFSGCVGEKKHATLYKKKLRQSLNDVQKELLAFPHFERDIMHRSLS